MLKENRVLSNFKRVRRDVCQAINVEGRLFVKADDIDVGEGLLVKDDD